MATWLFSPPARLEIPYEPNAVLSLFTRVKYTRGSTIAQLPDTSWVEYEGTSPQTVNPANIHFFGARGFADPHSQAANWVTPLRYYVGGHTYRLDDTLKGDLEAAVTTQEAGGYGAYITADDGSLDHQAVGDEIMLSGHNTWVARKVTST